MIDRALREWRVARARLIFGSAGVRVGVRPLILGSRPRILNEGTIVLGDRVVLRGMEARVLMETDRGARISIADRAFINSGASIIAADDVQIGSDFRMGPFASISDTNQHEVRPGGGVRVLRVIVGDDVWLGRASIVLPGVTIGDGSVVGAGSVVTRDVPPFCVVAGVPAKIVRSFDPTSVRRR